MVRVVSVDVTVTEDCISNYEGMSSLLFVVVRDVVPASMIPPFDVVLSSIVNVLIGDGCVRGIVKLMFVPTPSSL